MISLTWWIWKKKSENECKDNAWMSRFYNIPPALVPYISSKGALNVKKSWEIQERWKCFFFPPQTQRTPNWTPVRGPSPPRGTRAPPLCCMPITSGPPSPYPSPETSASSSRSRSLTWRPNTMASVWITWRYVCVLLSDRNVVIVQWSVTFTPWPRPSH